MCRQLRASLVESVEPLGWDPLTADRRVWRLVLPVAMPVAATRGQEAKGGGMIGEGGTDLRRVARVANLDGIEAFVTQAPEATACPPILEVRGRYQPAGAMDEIGHVTEQRKILGYERRSSPAEVAVERLLDGADGATVHQHLGHVRPANGPTSSSLAHPFELDGHAEPVEARHDLDRPTISIVTAFRQETRDLV